jgi:RES domain-containing protein
MTRPDLTRPDLTRPDLTRPDPIEVFRITKARYADQLTVSGGVARWNERGQFVIYTAASRALACLENMVHRTGEGLNNDFRVMIIAIPDSIRIETIGPGQLPENWPSPEQYPVCQQIGSLWLRQGRSAVLNVPSAIIPDERNYLLNPSHPDFKQITLLRHEPFLFDTRLIR